MRVTRATCCEGVVQLGGVDREGLQLAQDVGEPEADEADIALGHDRLDVLRGVRLLGHPADTNRCPAALLSTRGQTSHAHLSAAPARHGAGSRRQWPATAATNSATSSASRPW